MPEIVTASTTYPVECVDNHYNTATGIVAGLKDKSPDAPGDLLKWMASDLGASKPKVALDNFTPIWDNKAIAEFLGWKAYKGPSGWIAGGQFKPMTPIEFPDGSVAKYLTSKNGYDAALLKGPDWDAIADDPTIPIRITEGAKKAAALISQGIPTISIPGVDMGHKPGKRGIELVDNLARFAQRGRPFGLMFDADVIEKKEVQEALLNLAASLKRQGCIVSVWTWDPSIGKGIDDVIERGYQDKVTEISLKDFAKELEKLEKQFPKETKKSRDKKPSEFAREIEEDYRNRLAWSPNGSAWFTYADGLWSETYPEEVQAIVQNHLESQGVEYTTVTPIVDALKAKLMIREWERKSHLIPFKNGVFDIKTNKLKPHAPGNKMVWQLPHNYEPGGILQWPTIRNFLIEMFNGSLPTVNTICCAIAAGLRGMSDIHKFIELTGPGGTGKSALMSLIRQVAGEDNVWDGHIEDMNDKHAIIELKEKRFAIHDDQDRVSSRSLGNFKRATGGGTLTGRGLYKNACSFKATAIHWITTNQPVFYGNESHLDWYPRRLLMFECKVKPKSPKSDLQERFALEIGPFTSYLLSIPDEEIKATLSSRAESRSLSPAFWDSKLEESIPDWMDTHLIYAPGATTKIGSNCDEWSATNYDPYLSTLFGSYYAHGRGNGHKHLANKQNFSKVLMSLCEQLGWEVEKIKDGGYPYLTNLRLRTPGDVNHPTISDILAERASFLEKQLINSLTLDTSGDSLDTSGDSLDTSGHLSGHPEPLPRENHSDSGHLSADFSIQNFPENDFGGDIKRQTIWKTTNLINTLKYEKKVPEDHIKREIQRWYQVKARSQMTLDQLNHLVATLETWIAELVIPYGEWTGKTFAVDKSQVKQSNNKRMKADNYVATEEPTVLPGGKCAIQLDKWSVPCSALTLVR